MVTLTKQDFRSLAANRLQKDYAKEGNRGLMVIMVSFLVFLAVDTLLPGNPLRFLFAAGFLGSVVYFARTLAMFKRKVSALASDLIGQAAAEGLAVE